MVEVKVHDLELHTDARGWVNPMCYEGMGHVAYCYATACWPGVVKGWHRHAEHTDRLWCVQGMARVVVADMARGWKGMGVELENADGSSWDFHEFVIGPLSPKVVVIPPGWWHGFTPAGGGFCVVMNAPDMAYDLDDEERLDIDAIPFEWKRVDG